MKSVTLTMFGLAIGLLLAWMAMAFLVLVPAECGEPAACGDDYLYTAAIPAIASILAFPGMAAVLGKRQSAGRVAAALVMSAGIAAGIIWKIAR